MSTTGTHRSEARVTSQERFPNPGLPPHPHRRADSDPKAARRAEWQVAALFGVSILGSILFIAAYFLVTPQGTNIFAEPGTVEAVRASNLWIGLGLFLAVFGIGVAAVHWAKTLMPDNEVVEQRHVIGGDDEQQVEAAAILTDGIQETQVARRPLIAFSAVGALAVLPLAALFPLGTLGPLPGNRLRYTFWDAGMRLVRDNNTAPTPVRAADVTLGSIFHVMPEGLDHDTEDYLAERAKAATILIRVDPEQLPEDPNKQFTAEGLIAFSKICTHVGCPVALYEQQTHHLLCPCHQSTFDVLQYGEVIFGPAHRPLPQLPIEIDEEGYVVATGDFPEPIGPSFWEIEK